jgi:hypothetical protein
MDQVARDTMKALETSSTTTAPTRKRPGPKPGRKPGRPPGPKPKTPAGVATGTNGHAPTVPAVRLLQQQLADLEGTAGRIKKALAALLA